MRKILHVVLSMAMLLSIGAFTSTQVEAATAVKAKKPKKCLFPKSKKRAPSWVCDAHAEGLAAAAVGSFAKSGAGLSYMEQMAAADARANLVRDLHESVQGKIKGGAQTASKGEADGALIDKITNDSLEGSKIMKRAYAPNGTIYVLVGLDQENANKLIESIAATYLEQKQK
jgi:hypothetical protein